MIRNNNSMHPSHGNKPLFSYLLEPSRDVTQISKNNMHGRQENSMDCPPVHNSTNTDRQYFKPKGKSSSIQPDMQGLCWEGHRKE